MTDPKRSPNKQHKSFFWRRKLVPAQEHAKRENPIGAIENKAQPWYRPTILKVAVVVLAVVAILPTRAKGNSALIQLRSWRRFPRCSR